MKIRAFVLLIIITHISFNTNAQQFIPADNPAIQLIGRFDLTDKAKPVFMYSGVMIRTGFSGTSVAVRLDDDSLRNWFTVKLDDSVFIFKADKKSGIYSLAKQLPDKKHSIEISRRTEWHGGNTSFTGFEIDEGKSLFALPKLKRTIEFIGNSLTCGYGNEGKSRQEHFTYETENNYHTYGTITARSFNANYVSVCRSGIGMYQSYGGEHDFVQPKLYDEVALKSQYKWDYKNNQPDVVVIELGANDLAKPLDSSKYVDSYIAFVNKIRTQYPVAKIICVSGPLDLNDSTNTFYNYVQNVVDHLSSDKNIYHFDFGKLDSNGADWHPNLNEHGEMAARLVPFIHKITGW